MEEHFDEPSFVMLICDLLLHDLKPLWPKMRFGDNQMIGAINHIETMTGWLTLHQCILTLNSTQDCNAAVLCG